MSGGPECAQCGYDHADCHVTATGVDLDVPVLNGKLALNPGLIQDADTIQVEAICPICGHVRYVDLSQWEWA